LYSNAGPSWDRFTSYIDLHIIFLKDNVFIILKTNKFYPSQGIVLEELEIYEKDGELYIK